MAYNTNFGSSLGLAGQGSKLGAGRNYQEMNWWNKPLGAWNQDDTSDNYLTSTYKPEVSGEANAAPSYDSSKPWGEQAWNSFKDFGMDWGKSLPVLGNAAGLVLNYLGNQDKNRQWEKQAQFARFQAERENQRANQMASLGVQQYNQDVAGGNAARQSGAGRNYNVWQQQPLTYNPIA